VALMEQKIQFVTASDGVKLAVATVGSGPLLLISGSWLSHLELDWNLGRDFWERLAADVRLVRYDKRGMGLSDRRVGDYSPEAHVRDLTAVVEQLGEVPVTLMGTSQGGPISVMYANAYPANVSHLILLGSFHDGRTTYFGDLVKAFIGLIRADWGGHGSSAMIDVFVPNAAPEFRSLMADYQRAAADAEDAAQTWETCFDFRVTDLLGKITIPTLVLHRRGDKAVPFEQGRETAGHIPGALFVPLEGDIHVPYLGDTEPLINAIEDFMLGPDIPRTRTHVAERVQTVMFTDVEASTAINQRLGDERAQEVMRHHNQIIRSALAMNGGTEIKHTGDGVMASFTSATRAIQAAIAIQAGFAEHRGKSQGETIQVRIGLNAGEPIEEDGDLFGATVILASRIAAKAEGGEILVADTVRGLCSGKGFLFVDRGEFVAKGFDEPVRVYEVDWRHTTAS
jgi:class 3 adenylate cyclase/pimeloyl-ACP methyl ester carboxylesterase